MSRHLIIDGYNLIHAVPEWKCLARGDLAPAREALANVARAIHDADGIRVTVVFDGPADRLTIERPTGQQTFSLIYATAELSADGVIEQLCGKARRGEDLWVATGDNMIAESARANNVAVLTVEDFICWHGFSTGRKRDQIKEFRRMNRKEFGSSLGDFFGD